jgi:hypothetical protein
MNKQLEHFFRGVSNFFEYHTADNHISLCPKHRVEHSGKTTYSILIDLALYESSKEEEFFVRAKKRALHIANQLMLDPDSQDWVYWPGRLSKWNMSNSVIDSGACTDTLAQLLLRYPERLSGEEKKKLEHAVVQNAETYLTHASIEKRHTNQRLWGATGLASAYALIKKESWKQAVLKSVEDSLAEMLEDGTFPYVTRYTEGGTGEAICDTTTYYHSRHIAFMWHALEQVGELTNEYIERMSAAVELLMGMYQKDGIKSLSLETKRWYFQSDYEVASHSYDVYVFAKYYAHTKDLKYRDYAEVSLSQLVKHATGKDGEIIDNEKGEINFQCPFFWNSHTAWLARIYQEIDSMDIQNTRSIAHSHITFFPSSEILNVSKDQYACIIRGRKKLSTVQWGPKAGGGSLIYFGSKRKQYHNSVLHKEWECEPPLNFSTRDVRKLSLSYFKKYLHDYRMQVFHSKVEFRAGRITVGFMRLVAVLKKMYVQDSVYSTAFSTNPKLVFDEKRQQATFETAITTREGVGLKGCRVRRMYTFLDDRVKVKEEVEMTDTSSLQKLTYRLVPECENVNVETTGLWKRKGDRIVFPLHISQNISITYTLR